MSAVIVSENNPDIGDWLEVPAPRTGRDLVDLVECRLPPSAIDRILALGFSKAEVEETIIPLRTLQHRRSRREKLLVDESDRLLRVIRTLSLTERVYDSRPRALAWLRRENPRLGGRTPMSLIGTDVGGRLVEELLGQIDEGMFV